ncbi:MAG: CooT family nickel-binding protein [Deltaproteobacteria bacterium]|nr:CooT family nickel-binding protein [Candidatus Anaeroferrophillacea bacterium]
MCEANAYLLAADHEAGQLIMENVFRMQPEGDKLLLENIFGEQKLITADIARISLVEHRIYLHPR